MNQSDLPPSGGQSTLVDSTPVLSLDVASMPPSPRIFLGNESKKTSTNDRTFWWYVAAYYFVDRNRSSDDKYTFRTFCGWRSFGIPSLVPEFKTFHAMKVRGIRLDESFILKCPVPAFGTCFGIEMQNATHRNLRRSFLIGHVIPPEKNNS
jgi:hypothetical protein